MTRPTQLRALDPPDADEAPDAEFISLLTGNQRRLYAFILSLVRNPVEADDILQEANLVLWRKWADFTPGTDFKAWAFRVAQFQVMAHRKRQKRSKLVFDDDLVNTLAHEAEEHLDRHDERRAALSHCLAKLKPEQRRLIAQRYQPGASVNEMAAESDRSPKAMSEVLRRIRKNLETCIERRLAQLQRATPKPHAP